MADSEIPAAVPRRSIDLLERAVIEAAMYYAGMYQGMQLPGAVVDLDMLHRVHTGLIGACNALYHIEANPKT